MPHIEATAEITNTVSATAEIKNTISAVAEIKTEVVSDSPTITNEKSPLTDGFNEDLRANVANDFNYDFGTGDFSFAVWIKTTNSSGTEMILSHNAGADIIMRVFATGEFSVFLRDGAGFSVARASITKVNDGVWVPALFTFNGATDTISIYIKGLIDQAVQGGAGPLGDMSLSSLLHWASNSGSSNFFTGGFTNGSVWKKELTAVDAFRIFGGSEPVNLFCDETAEDLIGWWQFGDNSNDNFNVDVPNEWRFYDRFGNHADSLNMEFADLVNDTPP